jgi:hypothetical protein
MPITLVCSECRRDDYESMRPCGQCFEYAKGDA